MLRYYADKRERCCTAVKHGETNGKTIFGKRREKGITGSVISHPQKEKTSDNPLTITRLPRAENGTRTRDLNLGKVALSSPQNAARLGVTN